MHYGAGHDSVFPTTVDPFNATAGRCQFKGLADTSLVSRIHSTADFSAHQNAGDGAADRSDSAAGTLAHLVSDQSAGDAT
jgi:hypothetical protein